MKKHMIHVMMSALALGLTASASPVSSFDDIQFWTGSGANRSALVVDFQYGGADNSPVQSFVWGYRWDGGATGSDMLSAVSAANAFFSVNSTLFPTTISHTHLGNAYTQTSDFGNFISWGYYLAGGSTDVFDENWNVVGSAPVAGGGTFLPAEWTLSPVGAANRHLADGSWDAWSYGPYDSVSFEHETSPSTTPHAAIPEPGTLVLLVGGLLGLVHFFRRKGGASCAR